MSEYNHRILTATEFVRNKATGYWRQKIENWSMEIFACCGFNEEMFNEDLRAEALRLDPDGARYG